MLGPREIYDLLAAKHRLARETYVFTDGRVEVRKGPVLREASRLFGRLYSVERPQPPPAAAYTAVERSVPALLAQLAAWKREREGALVNEMASLEGPGGVGKSSYAYWLAAKIGGVVVYDFEELVETIRDAVDGGRWYPVLVLDDVATFISKYWFLDREGRRRFGKVFEVIELAKDFTGVILMTARSFDGIAKRLRELTTLRGKMKNVYHGGYLVTVVEWYYPGERTPRYIDVLWPDLRMPGEAWEEVMRRRREKILSALGGGDGGEDE